MSSSLTKVFSAALHRTGDLEQALEAVAAEAVRKQPVVELRPSRVPLAAQRIVYAVAEHFEISAAAIAGSSRERCVSWPRAVAAWLLRTTLERQLSWSTIALAVGVTSHTSAVIAFRKVERRLRDEPGLRDELMGILRAGAPLSNVTPLRKMA